MPRLFTYRIPSDYGSAPNPYGDYCTLVICKPVIRRVAKPGDWVVGIGSKNSPVGDIADRVVYAMNVTKSVSIQDYEPWCREHAPIKFPDITHTEITRRAGDCIFDYSTDPNHPAIRPSVHNESNRATDLGGENALISDHFWYFGDKPVPLPDSLLPIAEVVRGHKSNSNQEYFDEFVRWMNTMESRRNKLQGKPQKLEMLDNISECRSTCAREDCIADREDEEFEKQQLAKKSSTCNSC